MYDFCLFNAITNGIDLKDPVGKIKRELKQAYLKITKKNNIETSMESWDGLYNTYIIEPTKAMQAMALIADLQRQNVNDVVKAIAKAIAKISLSGASTDYDELLLSGILDVEGLNKKNSSIMHDLMQEGLWDSIDEPIPLIPLSDDVASFVAKCVRKCEKGSEAKIPKKGGPDKRFDIFGIYPNEISNLEILFGEISYGPANETKKHTGDDRIKLGKG
ncbi:19949_t:CDS:2, partial [Racocetra fulgida]